MADLNDVLDPERIAMLRELDGGDGTLLPAVADEYQADADAQLETMRAAVGAGDAATLQRAAHTLKGASANLGATAVAELSRRLEGQARDGDVGGAPPLLDAIAAELARVRGALRDVVAGV